MKVGADQCSQMFGRSLETLFGNDGGRFSRNDITPSRARATLLKRLADIVCLPISRINAFERAMTADLLADMLREAEVAVR